MNAKVITAVFAAFVMLFAGVMAADPADADGDPYSISYIVDGTTYVKTSSAASVNLESLEALGATAPEGTSFDKWHIDEQDYRAGSTFVFTEPGSVEATPLFKAVEYSAVFMDGDKQIDTVKGFIADDAGESVTKTKLSENAPDDLVNPGFIFLGWVAEGAPEGTEPVKKAALPDISDNITYDAVWMVDFVVKFVDGDQTITTSVSKVTLPVETVRTGFTFLGWFIGTEQITDPVAYSKAATEDTTFTAKWTPINVYVTFQAGDEVFEAVPVLYGSKVMVPALPEGFTAWDFDFDTPITEDITIEAIAAAPAEPTGLDDPVTMTLVIILGIIVCAGFVGVGILKKKGKIVIGRAPKSEGENKP